MEGKFTYKLLLLIFILYAANACYYPFQPVYFNSRELTFTQIGIAFAVSALVGMLFQPFWGYISDKYLNKRKTLLILVSISLPVMAFFILADSFPAVIALIIANNMFLCGVYPVLDAYIFDVIETRPDLSYPHFRFMASAAFAVTNLAMGYLIKQLGTDVIFIFYEALSLAGLFLLFHMKFDGTRSTTRIQLVDLGKTLGNAELVVFFLSVFLVTTCYGIGGSYMNELLKFGHGDVSNLGMVWFVTCVFEVMTFSIVGRLIKKLGVLPIYSISIVLLFLKLCLNFLFTEPFLIISLQALEGISYTLFITASLEFLNGKVGQELRSSAMSLFGAMAGLGNFTAGLSGGMLLNHVNPPQLFGILAVVCLMAFLVSRFIRSKKEYAIIE